MSIYNDYYNLILDGYHRVVEFKCRASRYRNIREKLAFETSDKGKFKILENECISVKIHIPTFGGIYPHGKPEEY
jgi:hypothetical protein